MGTGGLDQPPPVKNGRDLPVPSLSQAVEQAQGAELPIPEGTAESFHLGWFGETSTRRLLAASSPNGAGKVTAPPNRLCGWMRTRDSVVKSYVGGSGCVVVYCCSGAQTLWTAGPCTKNLCIAGTL